MSSDDFSDFDEGSSKEDSPSLDETLYDIRLFSRFMNYAKSQQVAPNLMFLKYVRLLRMYQAPREAWLKEAVKMIWTYFSDCATMPVDVSPEVKKKLQDMALDPEMEVKLDKDAFSVAYGEVYNIIVPHHRDWISTGEWREAIPFYHIPPPTFTVTLSSSSLRILFNKFLKNQLDSESDDSSVTSAYHLWKFCVITNDFRDGKYVHLSHISDSSKKKKKKKGDGEEDDDDDDDKSEKEEAVEKEDVNPEDYAKRLYKRYKRYVSLPYDGSSPYAVYIVRALDHAIEEFDKSAHYLKWLSFKQYQGVDYQEKVVHQTLTKDGFVEPPTLAAAMTSSMLPFFLVMLKGTEHGADLEFLTDVIKFRRKYEMFDKSGSASHGSRSGSASSDDSRKEMIVEAKAIFAKYLDSGVMHCDPGLVEQARQAISKNGGKGVTTRVFRKCAAFTYQRAEHSWARQARATLLWVNRSYDNHSKSARMVEEEFSMKVLPEGMDLQIVPTVDDVLACNDLMWDYAGFVGKQINDTFARYRAAYEEYFTAPVHKRKPIQVKVAEAYGELANLIPELQPIHRAFTKEANNRERLTDSVFTFLSTSIIRNIAKKFYFRWLIEHSMKWKSVPWTPVAAITYSEMSDAYGMSMVEQKIEEEALKGKSGLSRILAKRQVKKQSVANVRGGCTVEVSSAPTNTVFVSKSAGDMLAFGNLKGSTQLKAEIGDSDVFVVPIMTDILGSTFLRNMFEVLVLSTAISASDMNLWEALCEFYARYSEMDDEKLIESQDEMRAEIEKICDKYQSCFKNAAEIKERAKKLKIIFPKFFYPYEMELYSVHHTSLEKVLRSKGWK